MQMNLYDGMIKDFETRLKHFKRKMQSLELQLEEIKRKCK